MTAARVLHVLDHSLPHLSGYSVRSHYILRSQAAWQLDPVAMTSPKHGSSAGVEEIDGISYHRTPARAERKHRLPGVSELRLMGDVANRVEQMLRGGHFDVIHAHSPVLNGIPALRVGRRLGIPVVYEIRAFWEDAAVDHGTHREGSLRYRAIRAMETWLMRHVDAVGVISEGLAQEAGRRGIQAAKIFRSPNGVDLDIFRPGPRDESLAARWGIAGEVVIGFIGSFYRYEGLDILVEAFARLPRERPRSRLLLVGAGEALPELAEQARRLGVEDRILFAGAVPHAEIPRCYSLCDILVYPRRSMRLTELVTPLKPLEAMAAGRAVVGSDVGGLRELIRHGETGVLFSADSAEALAAALLDLSRDAERRQQLGTAARRAVEAERQWMQLAQVYARRYNELLGKREARR